MSVETCAFGRRRLFYARAGQIKTGKVSLAGSYLWRNLLRGLALAVRRFGVLARRLGMALGFGGFLLALAVIPFAVMFGCRPVALRGVFVMLGRLSMRFPGHAIPPEVSCNTHKQ